MLYHRELLFHLAGPGSGLKPGFDPAVDKVALKGDHRTAGVNTRLVSASLSYACDESGGVFGRHTGVCCQEIGERWLQLCWWGVPKVRSSGAVLLEMPAGQVFATIAPNTLTLSQSNTIMSCTSWPMALVLLINSALCRHELQHGTCSTCLQTSARRCYASTGDALTPSDIISIRGMKR